MKRTFKGGVHPLHHIHEGKNITKERPIEDLAAPEVVSIPMSQHVGAPARPVVKEGQKVKMGQVVGEAQGFVSVPVHASVSGVVKKVGVIPNINGKPVEAVVIENDFQDRQAFMKPCNYEGMTPEEIIEHIRAAGIVGMGGAGFPTHVKLSPPPDKRIDQVIINGAECEPFLTADHRMMLEHPHRIVNGIKIVMRALGVRKAVVGIEDNKPDAFRAMSEALDTQAIRIKQVETKYPQGSEKQLIDALTGRVVPSGGLPMDVGVVVVNVSTAAAIADAFMTGEPLIRRVVTVTGVVNKPGNYRMRIGASTQYVLDRADGYAVAPKKVISGGPMMGLPVPDMECVITKGYSGLLALDGKYAKKEKRGNCIRCGKCLDACPLYLYPTSISEAAEGENFEQAEQFDAMDCMSCGSCSFVCPAKIPIAQNIKFAKEQIMINRMKEKHKKEEKETPAEAVQKDVEEELKREEKVSPPELPAKEPGESADAAATQPDNAEKAEGAPPKAKPAAKKPAAKRAPAKKPAAKKTTAAKPAEDGPEAVKEMAKEEQE